MLGSGVQLNSIPGTNIRVSVNEISYCVLISTYKSELEFRHLREEMTPEIIRVHQPYEE